METLRKILTFLKNFFAGLLYPGLAAGFMLLIASALLALQPFDYFSDAALSPRDPNSPEIRLAWRALKLGAALTVICGLLIWLPPKINSWWKSRPKKEAAS